MADKEKPMSSYMRKNYGRKHSTVSGLICCLARNVRFLKSNSYFVFATGKSPLKLKSHISCSYQWACLTLPTSTILPISLSWCTKIPCISLFRPANLEASINHLCNFNSNTKEFPTHGKGAGMGAACIGGINQLQRPK